MSIELDGTILTLSPGPIDIHTHPRIFDPLQENRFDPTGTVKGKAGLGEYTAVALKSGIVAMVAMPNESVRLSDDEVEPFPIASFRRVRTVHEAIGNEAYVPTGAHFGLDTEMIFVDLERQVLNEVHLNRNFSAVKDEVLGLKIYGAETEGGYTVHRRHIPRLAQLWHGHNPEKPVILHLEDKAVGQVLAEIAKLPPGKDIPVHIAHVSSREELQAVIDAKQSGMNVTCEVTPHHLFLDTTDADEIGSYGLMKPTLKSREDVEFLWANLRYIDIFASDCAPHRQVDKEAAKPAYGVTNHSVMLPLLLGAVADGKLNLQELYEKLCTTPRERFGLPEADGSEVVIDAAPATQMNAQEREAALGVRYGQNPWTRLTRTFRMPGRVLSVKAGLSEYVASGERLVATSAHVLRPGMVGKVALL